MTCSSSHLSIRSVYPVSPANLPSDEEPGLRALTRRPDTPGMSAYPPASKATMGMKARRLTRSLVAGTSKIAQMLGLLFGIIGVMPFVMRYRWMKRLRLSVVGVPGADMDRGETGVCVRGA